MFLRLALLLVAFTTVSTDISSSEFCKVCTCNGTTSDVTCTTPIFQYKIFNDTRYWIDARTNESYGFKTVAIHKSGIPVVTPIPNSTVQVLDLSNNRIQVVEEGSFAELQNMHTLVLSNNQITSESLHPNSLKVSCAFAPRAPVVSGTCCHLSISRGSTRQERTCPCVP